jgi:cytochrome c553
MWATTGKGKGVGTVLAVVWAVCALVAGPARAQTASAPVQDSMAQRMQACVVCHGREGRATNVGYFPRIAGKPAGYLYQQLQNFRSGRRRNEAMSRLLAHLSDDYLREIAAYFSELDLPYPPAQPGVLAAGQRQVAEALVLHGDRDRGIPACVSCHGTRMAGKLPSMPGLLALPADYLVAQLGAWRTGHRKAIEPDCMADVARRLTPAEIGAIARWLSSQTLPTGTRPEPASADPLPLRCGSVKP